MGRVRDPVYLSLPRDTIDDFCSQYCIPINALQSNVVARGNFFAPVLEYVINFCVWALSCQNTEV